MYTGENYVTKCHGINRELEDKKNEYLSYMIMH